ncbi:MAG TPA: hypothetical protein VML50_17145 [Anaeromyxobacter sp.]|nr:hypothetical protein [Anaeromyxobacter sp.]
MTTSDRAALRAQVERFARERPRSVASDGAGRLLDVASGKALALDWPRVARAEERVDARTRRPYLVLSLDDGTEIALADQGIAFAPRAVAGGAPEGLPAAVCFRDLSQAESQLSHFLLHHPEEPADRSHLAIFLFCLAVVAGARAAGFDVAPEERRLEGLLAELEARGAR